MHFLMKNQHFLNVKFEIFTRFSVEFAFFGLKFNFYAKIWFYTQKVGKNKHFLNKNVHLDV